MTPKGSFLLILSFLTLLSTSCKQATEKTRPTVEPITAAVYASGKVTSRDQYQLFATVNGIIKEVLVKEGDTVKKGQPLFRIFNETAKLNAENARIAAEYADASNNTDRLAELKANIDFAKSKMKNDSSLYTRQQNLWAQGIGTLNELEQRELAIKNSKTAYEIAVRRYNDTKRQIEFADKQSKKNAEISTTIEKDFVIRSESDGRVYSILKEKGETVNTINPLAVIGAANDFILKLEVDEYDIAKVKPDQSIMLSLDSYKGEVFEARVSKIDPIMDERSRTFTVEAVFTQAPPVLYPNLTVEANIVIEKKDKALTIPRNYLVDEQYVLLENKEKKKVSTGLKDYRKVEILEGIDSTTTILKPQQ
ncbi:efflux RND transporter periplasmic adaptor subunit [Flavihumibacter rivuli]|uniref:efflux RND transporter periplasmic adaptor subunit n=1 Tax=Flavihumibacter rivuli TaxID=2838156 RepID=UPI001BDE15BE|nr:efflux RND transporter periplasmic adaptor subunit [Flavihumibacter rivuli]ULQ54884.1 efflux RND transporter periplasmic adaptor subunit [Flavihumibacter rivuli]